MLKERKAHKMLPTGTVMFKHDYFPLADRVSDNLINQGVDRYDISTCEFIGIHSSIREVGSFCLSSPLFLVGNDGIRPRFESEIFPTFAEALRRAVNLAIEHDTFVVIVDDPITGKTLDTGR